MGWTTMLVRWAAGGALLAAALTIWGRASSPPSRPVMVFAAASLQAPLREVAAAHTAVTGERVVFSFASSGSLAQQVRWGAPADVVVLADPRWDRLLLGEGLIQPGSRRVVATNRLVLVGDWRHRPLPNKSSPPMVPGRAVIADPGHVPLGAYALQALVSLGWWPGMRYRTVMAASAADAARLVRAGEADWGVVYLSDAMAFDLPYPGLIDESRHDRIEYTAYLTIAAPPSAAAFLDTLAGAAGRESFAAHHFDGGEP